MTKDEMRDAELELRKIVPPESAKKIVDAMRGCDYPLAAAAALTAIYKQSERNARRVLEAQQKQQKPAEATAKSIGQKPQFMPTSQQEFDALRFDEKVWIFSNNKEIYNAFVGKR